jgi:hypothetical protein
MGYVLLQEDDEKKITPLLSKYKVAPRKIVWEAMPVVSNKKSDRFRSERKRSGT